MIVVSGSDLCGKSTLVKRVTELLQDRGYSHMAHHLSRPPATWDYHLNYVERMCINSVWDRGHLDSLAYRAHDDHECSMTPLKFDLVEAAFRQQCGFQVVLIAAEAAIKDRFAQRGDPLYDVEHIIKVNESFKEMLFDSEFACRGQSYVTRVDIGGDVSTGEVTPERVVDAYVKRYEEFLELCSH